MPPRQGRQKQKSEKLEIIKKSTEPKVGAADQIIKPIFRFFVFLLWLLQPQKCGTTLLRLIVFSYRIAANFLLNDSKSSILSKI